MGKIRTEIYHRRHLDVHGIRCPFIWLSDVKVSVKYAFTVFNRMGMGFLTRQSVLREAEVQNLRNLMSNVQNGFLFFLLRASPGPPWYSIESMKGVERVPAQACVTSLIKIQHSLGSPLCSAADGDNFHLPAKPQTCWLLTQNIPISCQGHTLNHSWSSRRRRTAFTKWFCWILNIWKHSAFIRALI